MPDHVHMLVSIPPKISVSSFMGYLKGKSALMMFDKHANLKYKFGNRHFWCEGYYVSTVGLNEGDDSHIRERGPRHRAGQVERRRVRSKRGAFRGCPIRGPPCAARETRAVRLERSAFSIGPEQTTPLRGGS